MLSLYKGKNSPYWHFKVTINGTRKDISTKCKNKKDAEYFTKRYLNELSLKITKQIRNCPLLSVGLKHYITVRQLTKNTIRSYKNACEHLITAAGEKRVDEYDIFDYEKYITYLSKNHSETTKGIMTRNLFAIFNYYVKNEYIKKNPITAIRKKELPKPINDEELEKIIEYFRETDKEFCKIVKFALLTGFRRSTICDVMGINLDTKIINARNVKAKRNFEVPIYYELEELIKKEFGIEKLFVGKITRFSETTLTHKFRAGIIKLMEQEEIKREYHFHQLRHTAATQFGRKGLDIKSIKTILDHADIKTSENYVQTDLAVVRMKLDQKN